MKQLRYAILFILCFQVSTTYAHINPNKKKVKEEQTSVRGLPCRQGEAQLDMMINNVRARLLTGGDVWWNLDEGQYVVPRTSNPADEVSALFAGGVWIGGVDIGNNIKLLVLHIEMPLLTMIGFQAPWTRKDLRNYTFAIAGIESLR